MSDHTLCAAAVIDWLGDDIEQGVRSDGMRTAIVTEPARLSDTETMVSRSFPLGLLRVPQNSSGRPEHRAPDSDSHFPTGEGGSVRFPRGGGGGPNPSFSNDAP